MSKKGASAGERGFSRTSILVATATALILIVLASVIAFKASRKPSDTTLQFDTPYQAVLLSNGNVYFGRLRDYGGRFPVLTDVFYIQSSVNAQTKQAVNVLVKRGQELHSPDRMYLNPSQIILVEPVGPNSKVAQLIYEQKTHQ